MVFGQIPVPPAVGNPSVPLVPGAYRSQQTKQPNFHLVLLQILFFVWFLNNKAFHNLIYYCRQLKV